MTTSQEACQAGDVQRLHLDCREHSPILGNSANSYSGLVQVVKGPIILQQFIGLVTWRPATRAYPVARETRISLVWLAVGIFAIVVEQS